MYLKTFGDPLRKVFLFLQLQHSATLNMIALVFVFCWSFFIFLTGFFPHKAIVPGMAEIAEQRNDVLEPICPVEPAFEKLVFIVIDALREDFVYSKNSEMKFVQSLLKESGEALGFIALAPAPTVTLPRLKALTSGSLPTFLDVLANFDVKSLAMDSWPLQMHKHGKKLVFYGDDTWLKMLDEKDLFVRSEGTNSLFVWDTVEVDNNVTRHLDKELEALDWDVLILHYLGLDHIGHSEGSSSLKMGPKQREMDEIIEKLYNRLCRNDDRNDGQKTLFVILGDHGMNNLGNHGGSSTGETSPAMIFASPSFKSFQMKDDHKDSFVAGGAAKVRGYSLFDPEFVNRIIKDLDSGDRLGPTHGFIRQVDLVPTLSTLFCLPIPKMNIGQVIPALFRNEADLSRAKMQNIMQISRLMGVQADTISSDFSKIVQDLNHAVTGYDYGKLWIGMVMALATFLITYSRPLTGPSKETGKFSYLDTFGLFCVVMGMQAIHPLWWLISALGSSIILYGQIGSFEEVRKSLVGVESKLMTILLGFSGISMFSSSFVEEEYLTWNFICSTMALVNILWWWDRGGFQVFEYCLLLVSLRLGMSFNATGYQWIDAPSLQSFFLHQPAYYLDILYSLAIIFFIFNVKRYPSIMIRLLSIVSCLIAWTYSVIPIERVRDLFPMVQDSVWLGRSFYVVFVLLFNQGFRLRSDLMNRHFLDCLVITSFLLQKKLNVILIVAMHYILSGIKYQEQGDIFFYCLARYLFYAVGNSNGIATVDISHSYIGLAEFQYYLTGFITSYNWLFTPLLLFGWANLYCYEDERLRLLVKAFSQLYGRQRAKSEPNLELSLTRATEILSMASPSSVNPNLAKSRKCLKGFILFHMFYEMMVIFSCFHFRGHLFVWSVFAPKIIVEIGWALVVWVYVCLQVGLQSNTFLMDLIVIDSKTFLSTTNND